MQKRFSVNLATSNYWVANEFSYFTNPLLVHEKVSTLSMKDWGHITVPNMWQMEARQIFNINTQMKVSIPNWCAFRTIELLTGAYQRSFLPRQKLGPEKQTIIKFDGVETISKVT